MLRISCSRYSDLDDKVIAKATSLSLPLIGGTALEVLSGYYNVPGVRKRSDNDLDFACMTKDVGHRAMFELWVQRNIDPQKVQVDVKLESVDYRPYLMKVNGVLTFKPEYLIWSKIQRHSEKDIQDIKWLMSIPQLKDEEIVNCLEHLGVTEEEIEVLNSILEG